MMVQRRISRRRFLATTAAASATMVAAPFVRTAGAAGKLSIGMWDHWVPGANEVTKAIIDEWAAKEKVEVQVDFITSQGNKLLLTLAAEKVAGSGHDIMEFTNWEIAQHADGLDRVDDLMKEVLARNGPLDPAVEYIG